MAQKKKLKKNQRTHLNIELNADLFLKIKKIKGFFPSYLIGIKPETFIIIKTPTIIGRENMLSKGTSLMVRYSYLGDVYRFKTTVIGTNEKPFKVTYLSYPDVVEKIDYRNSQRVSSYIPASLAYEQVAVRGIITDISVGGCKFRTDSIDQVQDLLIKRESDVILQFPLLGLEGVREFKGKIKKVEFDNDFSLGIGFREIEKEARKIIAAYVKNTIEYRGN
jgi:c-di-GMP-binding flagellar brake protein YcgR